MNASRTASLTAGFIVCLDCEQERVHSARGLCHACYRVRRRNNTLEQRPPIRPERKQCTECGEPAKGRDLCTRHYEAYRHRESGYGRWQTTTQVPAAAASEHIHALRQTGMPLRMIGVAAALSHRTVKGLLDEKVDTVSATTADRILAIAIPICWPLEAPDTVLVDSTGTTRRLQALTVLGWPCNELAHRLDTSSEALHPLLVGRIGKVKACRARAVRDLYNELSMTKGQSPRSSTSARKRGWVPPLAWDDDIIDDPASTHDIGQTKTTTSDRIAEYEWLLSVGVDADEATQRAGVSRTTIQRWKEAEEAAAESAA